VEIPEEEYLAGMDACKHNLHGRIVWPKGATPLTVNDVKKKLSLIWKDLDRWGIASLGKGYYEFYFSSLEDVRRVRSVVSWNLNPGFLKLFAWSGDFNPNLQRNTSAQVWVRIYGLSQEYWRPKILFAIVSSIGTPICTDSIASKSMFERTFGQYARVLVDMDLSQDIRYKVLVERKGYAFFVDLDYENLPDFCSHCKMVGHYAEICKKLQNQENYNKTSETLKKNKPSVEKRYVQTKPGIVEQEKITEVVDIDVSNHPDEGNKSQPRVDVEHVGESSKSTPQVLEEVSPVIVELQNQFTILVNEELNQQSNSNDRNVQQNVQQNEEFAEIDSDDSTQDLAFVDATQFQKEDLLPDPNQPLLTPVRVQNDMVFLKDSWANMVDDEQQNLQLEESSARQHLSDDGFQLKLTKNQKKAQKKVSLTSKDSYATRSKVSQKPFK
jgi:hypothetical protein